ncbi:hypothetical protein GIB67_011863 [Kingdonia uniflora]|uniref:NAD(P)H-quinone oxidoreductase subunit 6, chloroplastic n=1 Tax=Kingdonia uniflora TaxID=39325 RepID=A0A7J7LKW3_9MAGN|nr:hypothetical protein GIB67_011863 [Kingdonia uniflora]
MEESIASGASQVSESECEEEEGGDGCGGLLGEGGVPQSLMDLTPEALHYMQELKSELATIEKGVYIYRVHNERALKPAINFGLALSLGLVLVCISLFHIQWNSHSVAAAQLLIYVGAVNVLIVFAMMLINGSEYNEYYNDFHIWTVADRGTQGIMVFM